MDKVALNSTIQEVKLLKAHILALETRIEHLEQSSKAASTVEKISNDSHWDENELEDYFHRTVSSKSFGG